MIKSKALLVSLFLFVWLILPGGAALADTPRPVWWAEYYDNPGLNGQPVKAIREEALDHDWGFTAPLAGLPADRFSVRWTTETVLEAGHYTISITVDDGARVWVDGQLVIDAWDIQSAATYTGSGWLDKGPHTIQMAYFENTGAAVAKLWWRQDPAPERPQPGGPGDGPPAGQPDNRPVMPVVIDNTDPGFSWGGPQKLQQLGVGGYGHSFYWTYNTTYDPLNYGKWSPHLTRPGHYEVLVFIPSHHATAAQVRYRVMHDGGRHDQIINQNNYYDQWVSLGTYYFNARPDSKEFIVVYDNTHETPTSTSIAFDAIKLTPRRR